MQRKSVRFGNTIIEIPAFLSRGKISLILLGALIFWLLNGVFLVDSDEQAVIKRFGAINRIKGSGLNFALPYPIESVDKEKVTKAKRVEIGFRTIADNPGRYDTRKDEATMLTGDENIVEADLVVQYKIKDIAQYLYNVDNQTNAVKLGAQSVLREVIGRNKIDEALTSGKSMIQEDIKTELQMLMDKYEIGVLIIAVQLQDVDPPEAVAGAFKDVASAKEDKNRRINEAQSYENNVLPKAKGEARKMVLQAEAYAQARIDRAKGDAERFKAMLQEYRKAKNVTKKRLYIEAMEDVLPGIQKYIIKTDKGSNVLNVLPFDKLPGQGGQK
jgi:membrane protease subunit HflK